jgi:hypothetical protein
VWSCTSQTLDGRDIGVKGQADVAVGQASEQLAGELWSAASGGRPPRGELAMPSKPAEQGLAASGAPGDRPSARSDIAPALSDSCRDAGALTRGRASSALPRSVPERPGRLARPLGLSGRNGR